MFAIVMVFAAISLIALVAGVTWWLAVSGRTTRRSGPDVGAEIMGGAAADDDQPGIALLEKSAFVGQGVKVEREAEVSSAGLKQMLRLRQWRAAIPPLLAMGGLLGLVVFGALALWMKLDSKVLGTAILAIVLFTVARAVLDFVRRS